MRWITSAVVCSVLLAPGLAARPSISAEPLHARIDNVIAQSHIGPLAATTTDGEFMRRVYLDFVGMIPSSAEARAFLDDPSPDKRAKLIDQLLADPRYARHLANVFDVMLMERRPDKHIKSPEWQAYLHSSFVDNKPFDQLAREILGADGVDDKLRPAVKFYLDRDAEPNVLTRDVGRVFFGQDLQCAQCHDHPLIDSYYQSDYYGLFAFVGRGTVFTDDKKKVFYAEKGEGLTTFKSVFTDEEGETLPRLPGGQPISEPTFAKGEEYTVKPAKNVRPVPKYSRRAQLAKHATDGTNRAFNRNVANRLWAHMTGRGLVDPVDLHHDDNPAAHPQLLEILADELVAMKFDIKLFLREVALSQTYQRSIEMPADLAASAEVAAQQLAALEAELPRRKTSAEQIQESVAALAGDLSDAEKSLAAVTGALSKANETADQMRKAANAADSVLAASQQQLAVQQDVASSLAAAAVKIQEALAKLPEDVKLQAAAATFGDLAAESSAGLAGLTTKIEQEVATAKKMEEQLVAAQTVAAEADAIYASAQQPVDALQQQLVDSVARSTAEEAAWKQIEQRIAATRQLVEYASLKSAADNADADRLVFEAAHAELSHAWTKQFAVTGLDPLTPEQLVWSILEATGQIEAQRSAAAAEFDAKNPPPDSANSDPAVQAERAKHIEQAVFSKLQGNVGVFVNLFGAGAGQPQQDFFATVDQALFFANGSQVRSWLTPSGNNLTARAGKLEEPQAIADELYISIFTRRPSAEEIADVTNYLAARTNDRPAALQEIAWALITSAEFRFSP